MSSTCHGQSLEQQVKAWSLDTVPWTSRGSTDSPPRRSATTSATGFSRQPCAQPAATASNTAAHALRAYVALISAHSHATSAEIMRAANRGQVDAALRAIDRSHNQLHRDRETLDTVEAAIGSLNQSTTASRPDRPRMIGQLAHRLNVTPATLRNGKRRPRRRTSPPT
jgi:hypothetical protein